MHAGLRVSGLGRHQAWKPARQAAAAAAAAAAASSSAAAAGHHLVVCLGPHKRPSDLRHQQQGEDEVERRSRRGVLGGRLRLQQAAATGESPSVHNQDLQRTCSLAGAWTGIPPPAGGR